MRVEANALLSKLYMQQQLTGYIMYHAYTEVSALTHALVLYNFDIQIFVIQQNRKEVLKVFTSNNKTTA